MDEPKVVEQGPAWSTSLFCYFIAERAAKPNLVVVAECLEEGGLDGLGVFYILTIIVNYTHQIIIFRMTPTTIPAERSLTYNFTTFAHVVSHAAMTRWRPVSSIVQNVHPTLICSPLSLSDSWALWMLSLPSGPYLSDSSPTSGRLSWTLHT